MTVCGYQVLPDMTQLFLCHLSKTHITRQTQTVKLIQDIWPEILKIAKVQPGSLCHRPADLAVGQKPYFPPTLTPVQEFDGAGTSSE
jgi:hypothetical protein